MGEIRNAERTQKNIIEAARKEFFDKGFKGARIEAIAENAGVKKQLIYHYFKGKAELLEAVLAQSVTDEPEWVSRIPDHPLHIAEHRYKVNSQVRADFIRFTAWESLESRTEQTSWNKGGELALQSYAAYWKKQQEKGIVPPDLEPELLALAITALTTYPIIFGSIAKIVTGFESTDPEFQARWSAFLTRLSGHLLTP
ncbi:TetR/AcrR family transcriptional regulator [Paenibacillus flagellatus]|uniref:TetR/AcrR family transcriptional regulator n=1 Tax=Paenibacillus flagellatus TaxID=2211139 RepID=A0A2V5KNP9_9BACL|nr:TetR/AcrR family transcriptional regulator [Paenibacillus flagellatus]PYI56920.1 TetR/AcrR family transcriptional regulator [Paenibacillus flagellatus]